MTRKPTIASLAKRINAAHEACEEAARTAIEHAFRAGDLLREAKAAVPHGKWLPWVEEHLSCSARTAQGYMRLAANRGRLGNAQRAAHLSVREALHLLADPRPAVEEGHEFDRAMEATGDLADCISAEWEDLKDAPASSETLKELGDFADRAALGQRIAAELHIRIGRRIGQLTREPSPDRDPALLKQWGPFAPLVDGYIGDDPTKLTALSKATFTPVSSTCADDTTFEQWTEVMRFFGFVRSVIGEEVSVEPKPSLHDRRFLGKGKTRAEADDAKNRFVPSPGNMLWGGAKLNSVFIEPSEHDGFYHVAHIEWGQGEESGGTLSGSKKPMRADFVERFLEKSLWSVRPEDLDWTEFTADPECRKFNRWMFGSYEQYLKEVLGLNPEQVANAE